MPAAFVISLTKVITMVPSGPNVSIGLIPDRPIRDQVPNGPVGNGPDNRRLNVWLTVSAKISLLAKTLT